MSYMKKDEDADQTMIKLDRTSVFQDGKRQTPKSELYRGPGDHVADHLLLR